MSHPDPGYLREKVLAARQAADELETCLQRAEPGPSDGLAEAALARERKRIAVDRELLGRWIAGAEDQAP